VTVFSRTVGRTTHRHVYSEWGCAIVGQMAVEEVSYGPLKKLREGRMEVLADADGPDQVPHARE
jgi:hypothetical protein